jgi:hypothetical protein
MAAAHEDLPRDSEDATVACHTELSNFSQDLLKLYFAKLPFENSISVLLTKPVDNFVDGSPG